MYPLPRCKVLYLVRHGQGYHNLAHDADPKAYESWDYYDASLTPLGWQQADALHRYVHEKKISATLELVVVSPLIRTLQTASGIFGGEKLRDGETKHSALMVAGVGQAKHTPISSAAAPPFVACEWCREHLELWPCNKRQSITLYKKLFPAVDFSDVETDEDTWWNTECRETSEELFARARKFVQWLLRREERHIAVVSHNSFLYHLVQLFGEDCPRDMRKEMHKKFQNCEMRSMVLVDRRLPSRPRRSDARKTSARQKKQKRKLRETKDDAGPSSSSSCKN